MGDASLSVHLDTTTKTTSATHARQTAQTVQGTSADAAMTPSSLYKTSVSTRLQREPISQTGKSFLVGTDARNVKTRSSAKSVPCCISWTMMIYARPNLRVAIESFQWAWIACRVMKTAWSVSVQKRRNVRPVGMSIYLRIVTVLRIRHPASMATSPTLKTNASSAPPNA